MGRAPCCEKNGLKKGPWTPEEDDKLVHYIRLHGPGNWRNLPKNAGLERCGKSCRLRWTNYLRPDIKRGRFSFDEEETIIQLHSVLGNKWSAIAARLPGRTDNEIKNYWNTHIRKRLVQMGLDPVTHTPRLDLLNSTTYSNINVSSLLNLSSLLGSQSLVNPQVLLRQLVTSTLLSQLQQQDPQNQLYNTLSLLQNQIIPPLVDPNNVSTCDDHQGFPMDQNSKQPIMQNNNIQGGLVNSNNTSFSCSSTSLTGNNHDHLFYSQLPNYNLQCNSNPSNSDHDFYPENSYLKQTTTLDNGNKNFSFESVMSTPLSSPTPPSTTYMNSSSNDQDDPETYCSNLFKFEIPESDFDISDFL